MTLICYLQAKDGILCVVLQGAQRAVCVARCKKSNKAQARASMSLTVTATTAV
jgi:hypothetical protein